MADLAHLRAMAYAADDAFDAALRAEGFRSRWEWDHASGSCDLASAYLDKIIADRAVHVAWSATIGQPPAAIGSQPAGRMLHS